MLKAFHQPPQRGDDSSASKAEVEVDYDRLCAYRPRQSRLFSRSIIDALQQKYLGSVLGGGTDSDISENSKKLPGNLPNTIKDAMTMTKRLGFRYLWIDRYCIDQNNEERKLNQCAKMDLIYQNSQLTIIAAIGDDPTHGLPGVAQRKKQSEYLNTCARIDKHFLISTNAWPISTINGVKWSTGAWTYQEALLSKRRLVFREEQMYFECYGMYCCESLNFQLGSMRRKDIQGFKSAFCAQSWIGMFPKGVGTTNMDIIRRVEEYSQLNLTNPSEILKAMLGIFNASQRSRLGIENYLGIPILPSTLERSKDSKPIGKWTTVAVFIIGLFWDLKGLSEGQPERRPDFPSWSWTGWHCPVKLWERVTSFLICAS
ncbi:hypothetical protein G7Y89_g6616 [Cudoniella acicularis]|uniref:Heterokaryon incompatibility domain-containing protein n=1 Tax=Cudoniella acicularis TaxID=354080 RepID=A0A8H4W4K9_9HELO|nr:hypothetical protein G7Y89_g6616 [Cudoniella acicularis]